MNDLQSLHNEKLGWATKYPALCLFPYNTVDLRKPNSPQDQLYVTCCCNLDTTQFTQGPLDDPFQEIKQSMERGVLPPACRACAQEEQHGGQSERLRNKLDKSELKILEFVKSKKVERFEFRIKFSSLCNLSCRSCAATESTTYAKITKNNDFIHLTQDIAELDNHWKFITDTILEKVNQYENFDLHLMGGEPLIQAGVEKLFTWIFENKLGGLITLKLTTALSVNLSDKMLSYFDQFRHVRFNLSIDSVGANYQYVRWPVKFEKIETNFARILEYKKTSQSWTQFEFSLDPVFSLNNIFYLPEYLDYWYLWFIEHDLSLQLINTAILSHTNHLDVQALPTKYRSYLRQILQDCLSHPILIKQSANMLHLYGFIKSTIVELDKWPENDLLWDRYLSHTAEFDQRTNTKFSILNKKLYDLLNIEDQICFNNKLQLVDTNTRFMLQLTNV